VFSLIAKALGFLKYSISRIWVALRYGHPFLLAGSGILTLLYSAFVLNFLEVPFQGHRLSFILVIPLAILANIYSITKNGQSARGLYLEQALQNSSEKKYYIVSIFIAGFILAVPLTIVLCTLLDEFQSLLLFAIIFSLQYFIIFSVCRILNRLDHKMIASTVFCILLIFTSDYSAYLLTVVLNPFETNRVTEFVSNQKVPANILLANRVLLVGLALALWSLKPETLRLPSLKSFRRFRAAK